MYFVVVVIATLIMQLRLFNCAWSMRVRMINKGFVKNHRYSFLKSNVPLQCTALSDSEESGNMQSNKKYNHIEVEVRNYQKGL
jgi:hypothetical protein